MASSTVAVLAAALTAGFTGVGTAAAQPGQTDNLAPSAPLSSTELSPNAVTGGKLAPRLATASGPVTAFIELAETPAVDVFNTELRKGRAAAKASARAAKARVDDRASRVVASLRGVDRSARELVRTRNAVPGVTVVADAAKLRDLVRTNPDVKSVRLAVPKTVENAGAAVLTRALNEWQTSGRLGDGIRVGVIDTGIDYTHSGFGGPGTTEAFGSIDETVVEPGYFPTAKVVGGWDFVGNAYNADSDDPAVSTPVPDPNPLDCNGHGSHVAGTAAGFGVDADGSTFTGDYAALTDSALRDMRIGPGMAPRALLYALKVFGCDGSTNVTAEALDWALDPDQDGDFTDHLDIVNLSLGSDYGAPDDPDSLFVRKLNQQGVLTVFSAGNGNDLYDIGGSPGNTPEALTVASTRDAYVLRDAADVVAPAAVAGQKPGQYSVNYAGYATLDLTDDVARLNPGPNADGCQPLSAADAALVNGKIAWLEWDDNDATRRCGSAGRTNNVQAAGAVGAVFTSTLENFPAGIAGNAAIPVFQFTGAGTAQLRPALEAGTLRVRLAGSLLTALKTYAPAIEDTPSSFTSRGTRTNVKPDVAAPGDTIASVSVGTGNQVFVNSGTSMAAPHVAGIAALVRQTHPDWTPAEVKAAIINTASADVFSQENHGGPIHAPNRVGTGRTDAKNAVDNQVLAFVEDAPAVVTAGFGVVEAAGPVTLQKTIRIVNKSVNTVRYDVAYTPITTMPGVSYTLDRTTVTLGPRGIARVKVTLKIDNAAALRKVADPTVEKLQLDVPRQFVGDASGRVDLTPTQGATVPLRVAVYSAPKPVADINIPNRVRVPRTGQGVLGLSGRGLDQGSGDARYQSLISALELQATSPRLPNCGNGVTTDCAMNETAKGGDLRYVGVASTAPLANLQGAPENSLLAFGLAMWGDWYNVGSNTQPFVDIDVDGDGAFDYEIFVTKPTDTDVLVAATVDFNTGATVDLQPVNGQFGDVDTNVFDTNVLVLPVLLSALGIDPTADSARITYAVGVGGFYATSDGLVDALPGTLSFDPLKPGLWVQGGGDAALSYRATPGTALVVNRDAAALELDNADSLLVINHHNARGDRASVVRITGPAPQQNDHRCMKRL
jgi:subtilisin family serine protease